MSYRIFTIDEANAVLQATIEPALERLDAQLDDLAAAEREEAILGLIADTGASESSSDRHRLEAVRARLATVKRSLREEIARIEATGALLKDLRPGLVDFFAMHGDQLVCLCWQRGEGHIRYWHTIEGGFRSRRPLIAQPELDG